MKMQKFTEKNTAYKNYYFILVMLVILLSGCHLRKHHGNFETIEVTAKPIVKNLYFSGNVKPISVIDVSPQVGGTVVKKYFTYGQTVRKGDLLLEMASSKYVSEYQQALVLYLKSKDEYFNKKTKFIGTQDLWKNKLISRDEYQSEESTLAGSYLTYLQARSDFQSLLGHDIDDQVTIKNIDAVQKMLNELKTTLKIVSPGDGIVLFSTKKNEGGDDEGAIEIGAEIKPNQHILSIGNLSGIAIDITVSEVDIDKIRVHQNVTISGVTFPEMLKGQVTQVGSQAKTGAGDTGHPTFSVRVVVPTLTPAQRSFIRVGMSTKVILEVRSLPRIMVPISAVFEKAGAAYVKVINQDDEVKEIEVKTGETTLSEVEIKSGLKTGDTLVLSH